MNLEPFSHTGQMYKYTRYMIHVWEYSLLETFQMSQPVTESGLGVVHTHQWCSIPAKCLLLDVIVWWKVWLSQLCRLVAATSITMCRVNPPSSQCGPCEPGTAGLSRSQTPHHLYNSCRAKHFNYTNQYTGLLSQHMTQHGGACERRTLERHGDVFTCR